MKINIEDYNMNDIRDIMKYSWSFDFIGIKKLIEDTKEKAIKDNASQVEIAIKANEINDFNLYDETMKSIMHSHSIEPLASQSFFLTIYSLFEASLDRYCEMCHEKFKLPLKLNDLSHKGVIRAIEYLDKVVMVDSIKTDETFCDFKLINKLRNDFIHSSGYVGQVERSKDYETNLGVPTIDGKITLNYDDVLSLHDKLFKLWNFILEKGSKIRNFKINFKEKKEVYLGTPAELYQKGKTIILKFDNQEISIGQHITVKRGDLEFKNEIIDIQLDGETIPKVNPLEIGIKFREKVAKNDLLFIDKYDENNV